MNKVFILLILQYKEAEKGKFFIKWTDSKLVIYKPCSHKSKTESDSSKNTVFVNWAEWCETRTRMIFLGIQLNITTQSRHVSNSEKFDRITS